MPSGLGRGMQTSLPNCKWSHHARTNSCYEAPGRSRVSVALGRGESLHRTRMSSIGTIISHAGSQTQRDDNESDGCCASACPADFSSTDRPVWRITVTRTKENGPTISISIDKLCCGAFRYCRASTRGRERNFAEVGACSNCLEFLRRKRRFGSDSRIEAT
jgi:hypothetical protein